MSGSSRLVNAAEILNAIVNDPDVLDAVAPGYKDVDMSKFFDDDRNVCFLEISEYTNTPKGALLFGWKSDDVYEMHWLCTTLLRGNEALQFARRSVKTLFLDYDAIAVVGAIPRDNRASRAMTRALGARPNGEVTDSQGRACIKYILERKTWATLSAVS